MGVPGLTLPDDPIQREPTYAAALKAFQALPPVRILFDNGAGSATPGAPVPGSEQSFASWPLPHTTARSFYLGGGGTLRAAPSAAGTDRFTYDRAARPATDFTGATDAGDLWTAAPTYGWSQDPAGTALSYLTPPLSAPLAVVGAGALQAWIKTTVGSLDLQVTVSEVRPDGRESYVQSGWLRTSRRRLDPVRSTLLEPVLSLTRADAAPMPRGRFAKVVVPLYYEGHAYRRGSRLRITIGAARGDQPTWAFDQGFPTGRVPVVLARSARVPRAWSCPPSAASASRRPTRRAPACGASPAGPYVPLADAAG